MSDLICTALGMAPLLLIGAVLAAHIVMHVRQQPARAQMLQDLRAGRIAQRLGLPLLEGDPDFRFVHMGAASAADSASKRARASVNSNGPTLGNPPIDNSLASRT